MSRPNVSERRRIRNTLRIKAEAMIRTGNPILKAFDGKPYLKISVVDGLKPFHYVLPADLVLLADQRPHQSVRIAMTRGART